MRLFLAWVMILIASTAVAEVPRVEFVHKVLQQGGFAVAKTAPDAKVSLNGKSVPVAKNGFFAVGFDRFQQAKNVLKVCEASVCQTIPLELKKTQLCNSACNECSAKNR